jgi:tetratricopeptide (TPR) repeat protein
MKNIKLPIFTLLLLFIISASLTAQNKNLQYKIDSITPLIERCMNCSHEYFRRAKLYLKLDDKAKAMSDLNNAIDIHIEYNLDSIDQISLTEYYNERANLKSELKDFRGAILDYDKASAVNVGYSTLWEEVTFGRGYCKFELEDLKGALEDFQKVLIHNSNNELAYYNLGIIKLRLGNKNDGCLDLSKAGELGYTEAYELISEYCN